MAQPLRSITQAALVGLVLGLVGAALIFVGNAVYSATRDCTFPDTEECNFELTRFQEVGRLQAFAAIGCAFLAGGLYLVVRRR